jgi:hypothetical protein
MRVSRSALLVLLALGAAAATGFWYLTRGDSRPLVLGTDAWSSWTIVTSDGTDPWIVGARPAGDVMRQLVDFASRRAGRSLVSPPHAAVPLVLQSEFEDSLQGVYGTDSVVRTARDAGIESATFQPVCLARHTLDLPDGPVDIYFVPLESPAFNQFRMDMTPLEPEHAGIGIYDPATLTPVLIVGATGAAFDRVWPLRVDPARDCDARIEMH